MPRKDCPQCRRRLPYAARRCTLCGWTHGSEVDLRVRRGAGRRRTAAWVVVALTLAAGGGVLSMRAAEVANWYADFAAHHLPDQLSSFAIVDTELGAFFYCARQVAREMRGDFSVETFSSPSESEAEYLGDGRYRITAHVEEARADGMRLRHQFACTTRYAGGKWALEELEIIRRP